VLTDIPALADQFLIVLPNINSGLGRWLVLLTGFTWSGCHPAPPLARSLPPSLSQHSPAAVAPWPSAIVIAMWSSTAHADPSTVLATSSSRRSKHSSSFLFASRIAYTRSTTEVSAPTTWIPCQSHMSSSELLASLSSPSRPPFLYLFARNSFALPSRVSFTPHQA